jgi:hypothetical protein
MKTSRVFIFVAMALVLGFLATRWCFAQPADGSSNKQSKEDYYIGLNELTSFVNYLEETKQTNTLKRFNDYCNATIVSQHNANLGVRLHVLDHLRNGRTNEAMRLLELQMKSDVVGFAASYRELPPSIREKVGMTAMREARDYCKKYPATGSATNVDQYLENAFTVLDAKATR